MRVFYKRKIKHSSKLRDEEEKIVTETNNESLRNKYKNKRNKKINYLKNFFTKKRSYLSLNILPSFLLLCETIILLKLYNSYQSKKNMSIKLNIFEKSNYEIPIKDKALKNAQDFLKTCQKGKLTKKIMPNLSGIPPIISIVVPIYKSAQSIKPTIRSMQNQNMQKIEIIIVNDFLNDNNIKKEIDELKEEDERIKLITNNKTMGLLYSRCIGILEAKGKYITTLDNEDFFSEEDVLSVLYNEIEENHFDVISFKGSAYSENSNLDDYKMTNVNIKNWTGTMYQPELGIFPQNENDPLFYNLNKLSGKLIKKGIYRAAINIMGKERFSTNIIWQEGSSIFYIICSIAQSFRYIEKYGLIHFEPKISNLDSQSKEDHLLGEIFFIDIVFDFSKNEYKKMILYKIKELKNKDFFNLSNEKIKAYLKIVVRKILNCEFIEGKDKEEIQKQYEELSPLN